MTMSIFVFFFFFFLFLLWNSFPFFLLCLVIFPFFVCFFLFVSVGAFFSAGSKPMSYEEVFGQSSSTNCTVYCGNLAQGSTEEALQKIFGPYGQIQEIRVFKDKGYAFIRWVVGTTNDRTLFFFFFLVFLDFFKYFWFSLSSLALFLMNVSCFFVFFLVFVFFLSYHLV